MIVDMRSSDITNRQLAVAAAVLTVSVLMIVAMIASGPHLFGGPPGHQPVAFTLDTGSDGSDVPGLGRAQPDEHWIDVDRSSATVTLYVGTDITARYTARVGADRSADGFYATALGTFHVYSMTKDLAPTSFYEGGYLTDWVGFDPDRYNGFHSPVRDASGVAFPTQNATTKGCVRLSEDDARAVYAFAFMGMRVEVHE